jgi:hypothetical protein
MIVFLKKKKLLIKDKSIGKQKYDMIFLLFDEKFSISSISLFLSFIYQLKFGSEQAWGLIQAANENEKISQWWYTSI